MTPLAQLQHKLAEALSIRDRLVSDQRRHLLGGIGLPLPDAFARKLFEAKRTVQGLEARLKLAEAVPMREETIVDARGRL